jgi:hypothetical protein
MHVGVEVARRPAVASCDEVADSVAAVEQAIHIRSNVRAQDVQELVTRATASIVADVLVDVVATEHRIEIQVPAEVTVATKGILESVVHLKDTVLLGAVLRSVEIVVQARAILSFNATGSQVRVEDGWAVAQTVVGVRCPFFDFVCAVMEAVNTALEAVVAISTTDLVDVTTWTTAALSPISKDFVPALLVVFQVLVALDGGHVIFELAREVVLIVAVHLFLDEAGEVVLVAGARLPDVLVPAIWLPKQVAVPEGWAVIRIRREEGVVRGKGEPDAICFVVAAVPAFSSCVSTKVPARWVQAVGVPLAIVFLPSTKTVEGVISVDRGDRDVASFVSFVFTVIKGAVRVRFAPTV